MTGLRQSKILNVTRPPPSLILGLDQSISPFSKTAPCLSLRSSRLSKSNVLAPAERSAPAQKPLPAPVTMIAFTLSSLSASSNALMRSFCIWKLKAFNLSGRFSVIVKILSSISYNKVSKFIFFSNLSIL